MSGEGNKQKTWIMVKEGAIVKNHGIEGVALAELLLNIQRVFDNIGYSKYGKDYKKEDCHLYLKEIIPGSVVLPTYPLTYGTCLDGIINPYLTITGSLERLMNALNTNPDGFIELFEEEIDDPSSRIAVLKGLLALANSDSPIEIKTAISKPENGYSVTNHQVIYLNTLLGDYGATGPMTIQGIVTRLSGDKPHYFTVSTKNGRKVKCFFDPKDEDKVQSLYKKWVRVTGKMERSQRTHKLVSVESIEEQKITELTKIGDFPLLKPIEFQTTYDKEDGLWGIVNEELALYGYGTNYYKTIASLEEAIEGHVLSFTKYPDTKHTEKSLLIKIKLQQHIDFKSALKQIDEKNEAE